ncbi:hypothetical protein D3C73_969050 [compost metagenome]
MIVLHEATLQSCGDFKRPFIEALKKKSAFIVEYARLKKQHFGQGLGNGFHQNTLSMRMRFRYWP